MAANSDYRRQIEDLVKRCEAVGWQVVKTGKNYYKVDTRRGIFTMPSTPSSAHSVQNTLALAVRHGLDELEEKLKLQREAQRQARINADRRANDALYDRIANGAGDVSSTNAADKIVASTPSSIVLSANLGAIDDGTAIVAVGPAMFQTPVMSKPAVAKTGEELLLADERVVYRCTYVDPETSNVCHLTFNTVGGLNVHNAWHVRPMETRPKHFRRYAHTRTNESETVTSTTSPTPTANADTATDRQQVITKLEELAGAIFDAGSKLIDVRNGLIAVADQVKKLPEATEPDPELVAKAAKFDALKGTLGGLFQ